MKPSVQFSVFFLSPLSCCPDAEDPVKGSEALEDNRVSSWKELGSLNDCVELELPHQPALYCDRNEK